MDSREKAEITKAIIRAMDAVNERQDKAIAELGAEVAAIRDVLVTAGIWPEVEPVSEQVTPVVEAPVKPKKGRKAKKAE